MSGDEKPIGVAVLGLGNVGSQVVRIIEESADDLTARIGAPLVLRGIGVRRVADDRGVPIELLTDNVEELVSRDDVDIVVEVMGPVEPARKAILAALEQGKSVVTANKALMAVSTGELAQAAEHAHVDLYFEAAVAGAIPVIRPLTQSLAGDTVLRVAGIVNGTTNYILSEMDSTGADYAVRAGRRERARLRRGGSDRRRRGLRRRRQGRDPGVDRLPHPGHRRRRLPRGHHQGHRRPTSRRRARWAARSSCWPSASGSPTTKGSSVFRPASTRRWCRWIIRWPRSTVRSTPWSSRPRPRAG